MRRIATCRWVTASLSCLIVAAAAGSAHSAPSEAPTPLPVRVVEGESPLFETLDRTRGLLSPTTNDIVVDRHGFVWIANDGGLHRFDGRNFYSIDRDPDSSDSLVSRRVYRLAESPDALWLGYVDGRMQRLDMTTGRLTMVAIDVAGVGRPNKLIWMRGDAHGRIWLLTNLGLLRYDPANRSALRVVEKLKAARIAPDGRRLFIASDDARIGVIDTGTAGEPRYAGRIPEADRTGTPILAPDDQGLWVSLGSRLWRFDAATRSLRRVGIPELPITRMTAERNGTLWMSTRLREGLYRLDPVHGVLNLYRAWPDDPSGLHVKVIKVMTISPDGDLWIGGYSGGIGRVRLRTGVTRIEVSDDRSDGICGLHENARRQLFITFCEKSKLTRLDLDTGQLSDLTDQLGETARSYGSPWFGLAGDGADGIWIASLDGLLHWRPQGGAVAVPFRPEIAGIFVDRKQRVWVPHLEGLSMLAPGSNELREVKAHTGSRALAFGRATSVGEGANGALWVGTTHGLIQYWPDTGEAHQFVWSDRNRQSVSDDYITGTHTDPAGRMWVSSYSGVDRVVADERGAIRFRRYRRVDGLPDISIWAMLSDRSGALWVTTEKGIARWDPRLDRFQAYLPMDGLPDVSFGEGTGVLASDGRLYIGSESGLWRIDPHQLRIATPQATVLSGYLAGETTVINLRGRDLPRIQTKYLDRRLVFQFAALGDPRNLSYRMDGLDERWQTMPANLTVGYHQLPPGAYRLEVSRTDDAGRRTTELSLPVDITPPPWRTVWAYLLYFLAIATTLGWFARVYVLRRRRRREYVRLLRAKDERLQLAMSASGDVMLEVDFENDTAAETGGEDPRDDTGSTRIAAYLDTIHPDDLESVRAYFEALQEQRDQDLSVEYRRRTATNEWMWVRLRGRFIEPDRAPERRRFTGMIHDITQERADLEMRQKTDQLRMQAEVRGQFLALVSHEIRTPLNGVVGMIELLGATALGEDQRKMLSTCRDSAFILLSIINDFLDLSKIEAGKLELERADVPLRDLVEAAVSGFRLQASDRGLSLDIYVAPQVPAWIVGDWVRLRQILANLISNAIKFTERGGVEVAVACEAATHELTLTVTDTGIGMDESTVSNLFQPFQQASASTTRRFGGTGLGLSIVKHLVEAMGGRIGCESRIGSGTRFSIALPVDMASVPDAGAPPAEALPLSGLRILAVASADRSRYLCEPLRWLGADVQAATHTAAAASPVANADTPRIDVVLVDAQAESERMLSAVWERWDAEGVPVLAVGAGQACAFAGRTVCDTVEANPLTGQALVDAIERALGRRMAPAAVPTDSERPPSAALAHDRNESAPGQRILLAEDNPINRDVFSRQLERLGRACDVAEDGEEAWTLLLQHPERYGLLITDAQMPRLDGYALATRIRERERTGAERLKILMITAGVLAGEKDRCLALGMDGFLSKPLSLDALKEKLDELLPVCVPGPASDPSDAGPSTAAAGISGLLELLRGNRESLKRILEVFVRTTRTDMDHLDQALQRGDRRQAGELAHRLKGSCSQLGQDAAARLLEEIEHAALSLRVDDIAFNRLVSAAREEVSSVQALVERYLLEEEA